MNITINDMNVNLEEISTLESMTTRSTATELLALKKWIDYKIYEKRHRDPYNIKRDLYDIFPFQ